MCRSYQSDRAAQEAPVHAVQQALDPPVVRVVVDEQGGGSSRFMRRSVRGNTKVALLEPDEVGTEALGARGISRLSANTPGVSSVR